MKTQGTNDLYKTDDIEERDMTMALRDLFASIAVAGVTENPLDIVCRSLVRCIEDVQFAFYCDEGDEIGVIAARKEGVKITRPPPDVQRKVVARLRQVTQGGAVSVISASDALTLLSPALRKKWKCHQSVAVRVGAGDGASAVLAVYVRPDFVVTDRHRAWMALWGDVATIFMSRQAAYSRAQTERDVAVKMSQALTLTLEAARARVREHLAEISKARNDYRIGASSLHDELLSIEASARSLYTFSDLAAEYGNAAGVEISENALADWVDAGLHDPRLKAIVGVRGSNKSAILHAVRSRVLASGVDESHVVIIDFEDARFRNFKTARDVAAYLARFPKSRKPYYLFMDEVGMIGWHAELLWGLSTAACWNVWFATSTVLPIRARKGDRGLSISVFRAWTDPRIPRSRSDLERIWCQIFMRDVVCGIDHPDIRAKELLAEYYSEHLGEVKSLRDIACAMKSMGRTLSRSTISAYRQALLDAYLIEISEIYDVFAEEVVTSVGGRAFYTDLELRTWRFGMAAEHEEIRLALNRLYLELRTKYDRVYTPRDKDADFVTIEPNGKPCLWRLPPEMRPLPKEFQWGGGGNRRKMSK